MNLGSALGLFLLPILGPAALGAMGLGGAGAAAAGGAAATGAAGGGLAGLFGSTALKNSLLPMFGTGIGTLLTGGSPQDAMRNAMLAGAGSAIFPGIGAKITGGMENLFGLGGAAEGAAAGGATGGAASGGIGNIMSTLGKMGPLVDNSARNNVPPPVQPVAQTQTGGLGSLQSMLSGMESDARKVGQEPTPTLAPDAAPILDQTPSVVPMIPVSAPVPVAAPYSPEQDTLPSISEDVQSITELLPYVDPITGKRYATKEERDAAADALFKAQSPITHQGYARGGAVSGPGTGTSDSIPAKIYQDGKPVQEAALSDGEFVMTAKAVRGIGNGNKERGITRMYELMRRFESGEI